MRHADLVRAAIVEGTPRPGYRVIHGAGPGAWQAGSTAGGRHPAPQPGGGAPRYPRISGARGLHAGSPQRFQHLFHMLLVRANAKEVINGSKLIDESQAATFLRRTH